jgi:hypothetical protein
MNSSNKCRKDGGNNVTLDVSHQTHQFSGDGADVEQLKAHICSLEMSNEELRLSVAHLRAATTVDLPPCYEANEIKVGELDRLPVLALT